MLACCAWILVVLGVCVSIQIVRVHVCGLYFAWGLMMMMISMRFLSSGVICCRGRYVITTLPKVAAVWWEELQEHEESDAFLRRARSRGRLLHAARSEGP